MIRIWVSGSHVSFAGPNLETFNKEAQKMGGKFQGFSKIWLFDLSQGMEQKIRVLAKKVFGTDGESIGIVTASSRNHVGHRVITHLMDENHPEKTICGRNLNGWIIKREYGGVNQFVNCKRCINIYQKHGLQPSKIPKK